MTNERKRLGYIVNAIFLGLIVVADICYMTVSCSSYITKTIASALFVACGVFNFIYCRKENSSKQIKLFSLFMLIGLVFAMAGDIFLIDFFVLGAGLFGLGHVFFFISYCFIKKINYKDFIFGAAIFIIAMLIIELYPKFQFNGMKALVIVYALVISLMLGKAISNLVCDKENKLNNALILVGAGLFFFSDLMLLFHVFGTKELIFDIFCLVTYYPAEFLLAFSIFKLQDKKEEQTTEINE